MAEPPLEKWYYERCIMEGLQLYSFILLIWYVPRSFKTAQPFSLKSTLKSTLVLHVHFGLSFLFYTVFKIWLCFFCTYNTKVIWPLWCVPLLMQELMFTRVQNFNPLLCPLGPRGPFILAQSFMQLFIGTTSYTALHQSVAAGSQHIYHSEIQCNHSNNFWASGKVFVDSEVCRKGFLLQISFNISYCRTHYSNPEVRIRKKAA